MTEVENQLLQALTEVEAAVKAMPTANPKPNLLPLFARVDELAGQLRVDVKSERAKLVPNKNAPAK